MTAVAATPSGTSLTISWIGDETPTSTVLNGGSASGLTSSAVTPGSYTSHAVILTGPVPDTRHTRYAQYRLAFTSTGTRLGTPVVRSVDVTPRAP